MTSILPILRNAAPRLTKQLFGPDCCRSEASGVLSRAVRPRLHPNAAPLLRRSFKSTQWRSLEASLGENTTRPLSSALRSWKKEPILRKGNGARKSMFPQVSEKIVAYWLLGSAASVFGIVVFGGLTRLTESG